MIASSELKGEEKIGMDFAVNPTYARMRMDFAVNPTEVFCVKFLTSSQPRGGMVVCDPFIRL